MASSLTRLPDSESVVTMLVDSSSSNAADSFFFNTSTGVVFGPPITVTANSYELNGYETYAYEYEYELEGASNTSQIVIDMHKMLESLDRIGVGVPAREAQRARDLFASKPVDRHVVVEGEFEF